MPTIFKAKTQAGHSIKILAELLQNNIKTACFEIDQKGIKLTQMDTRRSILIDLMLDSENFTIYKFKAPEKIFVGINLNHFHKMLKSVKKKDSLQLFIDDENPTDLCIKVIPKENNRKSTSVVKIQTIQTLDIYLPMGYTKSVIVPSTEFQKALKELSPLGTVINVVAKNFHIDFKCNAGGVMKKKIEFGELDGSDNDSDSDDDESTEYNKEFDPDQLSRITKISGLSTSIQIFSKDGQPLLFKSAVGPLGKISLYLKSKDILEKDSHTLDSDQDDD